MSKIKVCILAIFFSINITVNLFSDEFPCFDKIENDNTNYYLDNRLDLIDITVKNNRKWNINNRRLILDIQKQNPGYTIDGFGTIKKKYKKKFKAEIKVKYKDGNICIFAADVRQHGDMMDHVRLANGNVFQSLSVSLINGNINGVTKFILFLSGTRKFDDEIFITELLRNLNYLAPRTKITKVKVNNNSEVEMLFQEKASKELLESNNLREGPIFEGDETYRKLLYEQTNNLRIAKNDLSKQTNTIWAKKNNNFKNVSTLGLTYLNQFFLSNNLLEEVNNKKINFPVVNMDNSYLSLGNNQQNEKLDKFNILMSALNAQHGLINNNRKFYWNSIYGFFEPIYYDGGVHIETLDLNSAYNVHSYPKQEDVNIYVEELKEDIEKINFDLFYTNYKKTNILTTKKIAFNKKEQVIKNLNRYKKNYTTIKKDVTLVKKKKKEIKNKIFEEYVKSKKKKKYSQPLFSFQKP